MLHAGSSIAVLSPEQSFLAREQAELLHEEIARLPRAFRLAFVLCYLEGLTIHEAARRLRCSHGTVRSRMARARSSSAASIRRGVALPAAALAAALAARSASASVSPQLCEETTHAANQFAAGKAVSSSATALCGEVLRVMLVYKMRFTALFVLLLAAGGAGAVFWLSGGDER